jgi:hypothetical protein
MSWSDVVMLAVWLIAVAWSAASDGRAAQQNGANVGLVRGVCVVRGW